MELLILIALIFLGIIVAKAFSKKRKTKYRTEKWIPEPSVKKQAVKQSTDKEEIKELHPYRKVDLFLSNAERSFYGVLSQAVSDNHLVFAKVRVADVIIPDKNSNRSEWQTAFNSISSKHFDYLICKPSDCSVELAVELDDSSHNLEKTQERDDFIEKVCKSADVPLLRVKASNAYIVTNIRETIESMLSGGEVNVESISETPKCPRCGSEMILRKTKKGIHAGKDFWGCSSYPKCKTIITID